MGLSIRARTVRCDMCVWCINTTGAKCGTVQHVRHVRLFLSRADCETVRHVRHVRHCLLTQIIDNIGRSALSALSALFLRNARGGIIYSFSCVTCVYAYGK